MPRHRLGELTLLSTFHTSCRAPWRSSHQPYARSRFSSSLFRTPARLSAEGPNGFAQPTKEKDFEVRNGLDRATLVDLFAWTEVEFDQRMQGSAIRRIGYERWLRNLAVGLGNAATSPAVISALKLRLDDKSPLVKEHVLWALARHERLAA